MHYVKKCPLCGEKLELDDVDFNFNGNQDEYSFCNYCHHSFIFYIRFGKTWQYEVTKMYFDECDKCWYCSEKPCDTQLFKVNTSFNKKG